MIEKWALVGEANLSKLTGRVSSALAFDGLYAPESFL